MLDIFLIYERVKIDGISYLKYCSLEIGYYFISEKENASMLAVFTGNLAGKYLHTLNYKCSKGEQVDDRYLAVGYELPKLINDYNYKGSFDFNELQEYIEKKSRKYCYVDKNGLNGILDKTFEKKLELLFNANEKEETNIQNSGNYLKNIPNIKKYGIILNDENYKCNPCISREKELESLIKSLIFKDTSCILVGKPGIGKTSIVNGLAYRIKNNNVPNVMKDKKIVMLSTSSLVSGCSYVGMLEKRLEEIIKEFQNNENLILFIDEIHNVIGAGAGSKSNIDIAAILKPYMETGKIQVIGTTTEEEYEILKEDKAFESRFNKIKVNEPSELELLDIVYGNIEELQSLNNISVKFDFEDKTKDVIELLIYLTNKDHRKYDNYTNNPRLILQLIRAIFARAVYNDHEKVLVSDIIQEIDIFDKIQEKYRKNAIFKIESILNNTNEPKKLGKIIDFNSTI